MLFYIWWNTRRKFIISGIILRYWSTNFALIFNFAWKECTYKSNVAPKGFFSYVYLLFRMTVSEEVSTSLSVNIFKHLSTNVTKDSFYNTDTLNDFTTDIEQNCSNNNLVLVTALKQPIDRMKRQLSDKQFIIELLLANLQHCSYNTSVSTGIQVLVKKQEKISIWSVQK